jgi:hypothetical protein
MHQFKYEVYVDSNISPCMVYQTNEFYKAFEVLLKAIPHALSVEHGNVEIIQYSNGQFYKRVINLNSTISG